MTTVKAIEKAVSELPPEKLSIFRSWFARFDAVLWDKQMEEDAKTGRMDAILVKVCESYKKGKCKEL